MPGFRIKFYQEWREGGEIVVDCDNGQEACAAAEEILKEGNEDTWNAVMIPGDWGVESAERVEEVENKPK